MVRDYNIISADSHLETPPTLWTDRIPASMRDKAPRVVDLPDGGEGWAIGEGEPAPLGLNATGGQRYTEFVPRGLRYTDTPPGTGGPEQRIAEQDRDGSDAEVLFSTVIGSMLSRMEDRELLVASVRAYNDWLSEYCSYAPDRLFGIALTPFTGVEDAVAELKRVGGKPGIRGMHLLQFPSGQLSATPADEPFWQAAAEHGVTIVAHHNFGGEKRQAPLPGLVNEKAVEIEGTNNLAMFAWLLTTDLPMPTLPILTLLQLMVSGVLDRNPDIRFHFAETGIGWLPYWLEQMEDRYDRHRYWAGIRLARRPVEYIRDHFTFSFQEDHAGIALRHSIGVNNICWASDFPHAVSDWPLSRETRARQFTGVPDDERKRIQALNIATQLHVITPQEREEQARRPLVDPLPPEVAPRGYRRLSEDDQRTFAPATPVAVG
jgi:predicted TIM-barrel fold metal-dependent hydrolase